MSTPCRLLLEPLLPLSATFGEFIAASPEQQADYFRRLIEASKSVGQQSYQEDWYENERLGGVYR